MNMNMFRGVGIKNNICILRKKGRRGLIEYCIREDRDWSREEGIIEVV
jgi:hypothetical protein